MFETIVIFTFDKFVNKELKNRTGEFKTGKK